MNISFSLTTDQFRARTKDVTRRLGWLKAYPGQILTACEKCQGLKKGEHPVILGKIEVVSVRCEPLFSMALSPDYGRIEVIREGFPNLSPDDFVCMFCNHNHCQPSKTITRIEFKYLDSYLQPLTLNLPWISPSK